MSDVEVKRSRAPWGTADKIRLRVAETLASGYALTDRDIQKFAAEMGMSPASWRTIWAGKEIHPFPQKHGKHATVFFVDPSLDIEKDTDFFTRLKEESVNLGLLPLSTPIILALAR